VNTRSILVCAFALAASLGCDDPKPNPTPTPPTASATTAVASVKATATAAPSTEPAGAERGKMAHCPSAVDGAATDVADVDGGVVLTVTAKDEAKTKEIRERSKFLADASKTEAPSTQHNGSGQGGGALGRCPVVNRNTTVETADVEGGSKITVKPKNAAEVDWVRRESRERLKEIAEPGGRDAGQGKMAHCPSTVDGATTSVKATKDAVVVTVIAKDEAKTKEIRERAKTLVEAAKKDPTGVSHKGDGSGGGGFGRCPVVIKDTTVEAKDVAGGSELTVKPKSAAEVAALEKEAKDRVEKIAGTTPAK
jgi:hypothetical protein